MTTDENASKTILLIDAMEAIGSNLNHILQHCKDGAEAENFSERIDDVRKHAAQACIAFLWIDNFAIIKPTA